MQVNKHSSKHQINHVTCSFTGKNITKYAGANSFAKYLKSQKIQPMFDEILPTKFANASKYSNSQVLLSFLMGSFCGINRLNKIENFTQDPLIQHVLGTREGINENTIANRISALGEKGARALSAKVLEFNSNYLKIRQLKSITFDADSTVSIAYGSQEGASKGYNPIKKGAKSYHPLLLFNSNSRTLHHTYFRPGNSYTSNGIREMLLETKVRLPKNIEKVFFRADSGFFDVQTVACLEEMNWDYLIKVKLKNMHALLASATWQERSKGIFVAEIPYKIKGKQLVFKALKTLVSRENIDFFGKQIANESYEYTVFATNLEGNGSDIFKIYSQRAVCETWIEQVKSQLMAGKTLTQSFWTNDILWQLCSFAYNLSVMMRKNTDKGNKKVVENQEHKTFLDWFIKVPATLVSGGRKLELKMYRHYAEKEKWMFVYQQCC